MRFKIQKNTIILVTKELSKHHPRGGEIPIGSILSYPSTFKQHGRHTRKNILVPQAEENKNH
jgi:hypothetical protein